MGEDLEFSIRIIRSGFRTALFEEAYVYHKRRTNFRGFFRQLHFFGRARVNIRRFYPDEVKPIHLMPAVFLIGLVLLAVMPLLSYSLFLLLLTPYLLFTLLLLIHAYWQERSMNVAILAVPASCIQIAAYGAGFLQELFRGNRKIEED
jgi:GT2 family glycosyltransferase